MSRERVRDPRVAAAGVSLGPADDGVAAAASTSSLAHGRPRVIIRSG
ncbi:MAG: hypothetical protein ACLPZR_23145 [Solirubrobacteraceae bacterium]